MRKATTTRGDRTRSNTKPRGRPSPAANNSYVYGMFDSTSSITMHVEVQQHMGARITITILVHQPSN
jgi:hypothetical protein